MSTATRLLAYGAALVLVFGGAWSAGGAFGTPPRAAPQAHTGGPAHGIAHGERERAAPDPAGSDGPRSDGLAAAAAGYRLVPAPASRAGELAFTVTGPDGRPVPGYRVDHGEGLHLVVVRDDGTGYQHPRPVFGGDGVGRAPVAAGPPGAYRVLADFTPSGGPRLVLGTDLFVPGPVTAIPTPTPTPPSRVWQAGGYQVRLDGDLVPGTPSQVFATISEDGVAVTDLEPYQGAFGHLVALRSSDLSYVAVHPSAAAEPAATDRSGPGVAFVAEVPTEGTYRLFLDFVHDGAVRTAEFTIATRGAS